MSTSPSHLYTSFPITPYSFTLIFPYFYINTFSYSNIHSKYSHFSFSNTTTQKVLPSSQTVGLNTLTKIIKTNEFLICKTPNSFTTIRSLVKMTNSNKTVSTLYTNIIN